MHSVSKQIIYRDGKRNRRPTSCEQCRIRKAKCNRELPCETCIKRGERSACKYASNAIRNAKPRGNSSNNVGDRLQRVENMVYQLLGSRELSNNDSSDDNNKVKSRSGTTAPAVAVSMPTAATHEENPDPSPIIPRSSHVESTHWLSILNDIKEVREQLSQSEIFTLEKDHDVEEAGHEEVDLMLRPPVVERLPDMQDVLYSLPSRSICDKLLSQYFNSPMTLPIIHTIKFQNEYEKFWHDPSRAPPLWIGLLFSILSIAAAARQLLAMGTETGDQPAVLPVKIFRARTAQCLIMGNYTNATSYGLETLTLFLLSKYIGEHDSSFDSWLLMGTIIRLAIRMGYHHDPKSQPNISPFEGEMRRRRWHAILQLDVLLSFQMGMPSMIPAELCDTEPPINLNDSDIYPNMKSLPPSRPLTDWTPTLYTIVKGKIMAIFRQTLAHTQQRSSSLSTTTSSSSYPTTIALDSQLRETYASLPDDFKMRPISQSFTVSAGLIMGRCTIELLYLKGIIVLHRQYLNTAERFFDRQREFSRCACVNAALDILARQADLHEATQPHGRLYQDRWMLLSSLSTHDFLLASMVVCLELSVLMRMPATAAASPSSSIRPSAPHMSKLLNALLNSQRIWASRSSYSKESHTAALILQLMIDKVQAGGVVSEGRKIENPSNFNNINHTNNNSIDNNNNGNLDDDNDDNNSYSSHTTNSSPQQKSAMNYSTTSTSINDNKNENRQNTNDTPDAPPLIDADFMIDLPFAETMTDMIDGSENLDWALLDQYLQNPGSGSSASQTNDIPSDENYWDSILNSNNIGNENDRLFQGFIR